ncbi:MULTISPECIES: NrtA/SsuA/CpmA family ABC transporter substrate-binding protein [unclassified Methylibium]|uniref:NrtA/SsuA/CpmA family ABC transporter substrate-binding protein n=1 Tax=unclassified Methylibium TaxID=2633235 RepID=UPI0003F460AC|nr:MULTISPECIES: NrtA/SsuA/CpmA family ABC transporter substrate-binding protein [unclassified Methylibium]EWS56550.1 Sulfate starvation-induced protein 1 [Methylibium sp. T29]EWS61190.1 Sulfate starvation-induced protein 1 [Methylibium sp. T29-B]
MTFWMNQRVRAAAAAMAVACGLGIGAPSTALAADLDYGKPGDPVQLVIGYQPYYTQSWSGVVMRGKKFYEKYLPKGSTVDFSIGLQGAVIVNAMLAGKQHIGYMGDMPAIVSTTKESVADIRIVATLGVGFDQCNILLARNDAPKFGNGKEGVKWLEGKRIGIPLGSCADRFAKEAFRKEGVAPAAIMNQNIEVITSGFRAGKLDAAAIWEPTASRLVEEGLARRIASGATVNEKDAGFLAMRADLIKQRPDVAKAWLNAELDAQLFLADPKNAMEVAAMAAQQATGFTEKMLWHSLYGQYPAEIGGIPVRMQMPFTLTPDVVAQINQSAAFLFSIKSINVEKLRADALMNDMAAQVLKERNLSSPIGEVKSMPDSEYGKK